MAWLLCLIRLCLAFLLVSCSAELNQDLSVGRKLCGSNLLREILLLCGKADWSQFPCRRKPSGLPGPLPSPKPPGPSRGEVETEQDPFSCLATSEGRKMERKTGAKTVSTSASQEEAINNWKIQSSPEYHYRKTKFLLRKTREFSLRDVDPHVQESVKMQKKSTNKMKTSRNLFWGNHPQRKRRGYSDKCCLKGCTKEELAIACFPYIDS